MADSKITALTALTAADPANDMLPVVDVSDTSMAASGTTKRISINNILACSPSATLASATISGDLTARNWFLTGGSLPGVGNGNPFAYRIGGGGLGIGAATETGTTAPIVFYCGAGGVEQYRIAPLGVNTWSDGAGGTRMTLNSTGLGVGTAPANVITARAAQDTGLELNSAASNASRLIFAYDPANTRWYINSTLSGSGTTLPLAFLIGNSERMRIDTSGNVGIGVTTFGTSAAKVLSIGTGTEPTTGPAGSVQFFTSTRSASNTIPAIFTEGSGVTNAAITNTTVTNKIAIKVNGTIYYLLATTSAA